MSPPRNEFNPTSFALLVVSIACSVLIGIMIQSTRSPIPSKPLPGADVTDSVARESIDELKESVKGLRSDLNYLFRGQGIGIDRQTDRPIGIGAGFGPVTPVPRRGSG